MRIRHSLAVAALAAGIGGLILPALAQPQDDVMGAPNQGMSGMASNGRMGHGMMSRGGMMGGGCTGMMQSMNNGGGRPNSQWRDPRGNDTRD